MQDLLRWINVLHNSDDVVEIRSISPKPVISGYFRAGSPNIASELQRYPDRTFYQTMNMVDDACYSRGQHEHLVAYPSETTSDGDIIGYSWILIDADPVRKPGVSATNDEKAAALVVARQIWRCLKHRGFMEPVVADSGNGYHLLYHVCINPREKPTIETFLKVLDMWFSTDTVKIDTAVFNPARITKLYGTVAHKGADTEERPHRHSRIMKVPDQVLPTPFQLIQEVAAEYVPDTPQSSALPAFSDRGFDLESFLAQHQIAIAKKTEGNGFTKYVLEECPFDPAHKAPDSAVFRYANGTLGFKCFHNSCSDHGWHDFRMKIDPNAYTVPPVVTTQPATASADSKTAVSAATNPATETTGQAPIMINITDVEDYDRSKVVAIKSRFARLDALIGGFNKGELSIWSGGNASGKSTLVSQLGLEAIHQGFKVALFSGEMHRSRVKDWLYLQAAGRDNVEPDPTFSMHYRLKFGVKEQLNQTLNGMLSLYNNDYGNSWEDVTSALFQWVYENQADVIIIDNLMALNFAGNTDKYELQTVIVKTLAQAAKQLKAHIHFICHPRKTDAFLRKNDISGSADITNAADNVFMVHRVNNDFRLHVKEVYPRMEIPGDVGNAVEIMKNRDLGVSDEMILLYFDKTCKTMCDVKGGLPRFGWAERMVQVDMSDDPGFPAEWR